MKRLNQVNRFAIVLVAMAMAALGNESFAEVRCPTTVNVAVAAPGSGSRPTRQNQSFVRGDASLPSQYTAQCRLFGQRTFTTHNDRTGSSCDRRAMVLDLRGPSGWFFTGNSLILRLPAVQGSAVVFNGRNVCRYTAVVSDPNLVRPKGTIACVNPRRDGFLERSETSRCPGPR